MQNQLFVALGYADPRPDTKIRRGFLFLPKNIFLYQKVFLILHHNKRPDAFPGQKKLRAMKINNSEDLTRVSEFWRIEKTALSRMIIFKFIKAGFIVDGPEFYGSTVEQVLDGEGLTIEQGLTQLFPLVTKFYLKEFGALKFMGEGECPNCGGEAEYYAGDSKHTAGDHLTPPEHQSIWEQHKCTECGHIFNI